MPKNETEQSQNQERNAQRDRASRIERAGASMQKMGRAEQGAGKTAQTTGWALKKGGRVMTKGGAALSSTGVGAVVGVPLAGAGAVTTGVGRASESTGRRVARHGKKTARAGTRTRHAGRRLKKGRLQSGTGQRSTIHPIMAVLMIACAVFVDVVVIGINLLHAIPIVGNAMAAVGAGMVNFFAGMVFMTWLVVLGVPLMRPQRAAALSIGWILAPLPLVNAVPGWTIAISFIVFFEYAEKLPGIKNVKKAALRARI